MAAFLLINGPNLNLLGLREPEVYGATRLKDIEAHSKTVAADLGHTLESYQSNAEHELIDAAAAVVATLERALGFENDNATARELFASYYFGRVIDAEQTDDSTSVRFNTQRAAVYDDGSYTHKLKGDGSLF